MNITMKNLSRKKRKRNPNWDDAEKALLRDCLKDKLDIIENKCTDTNTNNIKKIAWQKVFESFNELNTKQRTLTEIKQQWRTLKIDANKNYSSFGQVFLKTQKQTGEDEPPSPSLDQNTIDILETVQLEFEEGANEFDCDNITHNTNVTKIDDIDDRELENDDFIKDQTPKEIAPTKKPDRRVLIESRLKTSGRKRQKINEEPKVTSNNRLERDTALIALLREEHELKMEHMVKTDARAQEEHVLRIKNLKLQNELLEKQLSNYNK